VASVTITGPAEVLDQLTDELGREPDVRLRRLALDELEAAVEDAPEFIVKMRVEARLGKVDGTKRAHVA
jgi:hypothetical protein